MDWLPLERLSEQIHMVISTLPDERSPPDGRPFRCLSQLERRLVSSDTGGRQQGVQMGESAGITPDAHSVLTCPLPPCSPRRNPEMPGLG